MRLCEECRLGGCGVSDTECVGCEVRQLRAEAYDRGRTDARTDERARIVAWLRNGGASAALEPAESAWLADAPERG
jgi:hypothetical protein